MIISNVPKKTFALLCSFSNSIGGSDAVSPITAERNIKTYYKNKNSSSSFDLSVLKAKLNNGKLIGITAFVFVLVLLGIADWLAIYHIWKGWFPQWEGFNHVPQSLFDKDIGITTLPNYFIGDVPSN